MLAAPLCNHASCVADTCLYEPVLLGVATSLLVRVRVQIEDPAWDRAASLLDREQGGVSHATCNEVAAGRWVHVFVAGTRASC